MFLEVVHQVDDDGPYGDARTSVSYSLFTVMFS